MLPCVPASPSADHVCACPQALRLRVFVLVGTQRGWCTCCVSDMHMFAHACLRMGCAFLAGFNRAVVLASSSACSCMQQERDVVRVCICIGRVAFRGWPVLELLCKKQGCMPLQTMCCCTQALFRVHVWQHAHASDVPVWGLQARAHGPALLVHQRVSVCVRVCTGTGAF